MRRAHYEADRATYDVEHGPGAFSAYYSRHPFQYDGIYGPGAWDRDFGAHGARTARLAPRRGRPIGPPLIRR